MQVDQDYYVPQDVEDGQDEEREGVYQEHNEEDNDGQDQASYGLAVGDEESQQPAAEEQVSVL